MNKRDSYKKFSTTEWQLGCVSEPNLKRKKFILTFRSVLSLPKRLEVKTMDSDSLKFL